MLSVNTPIFASLIITACSELRKVLFLVPFVSFLCVWNVSGTAERICAKFTRKTCMVPLSGEFEGQGQRWKVKVTRAKKQHFWALSTACVQFMFGITSLASSWFKSMDSCMLFYQIFTFHTRGQYHTASACLHYWLIHCNTSWNVSKIYHKHTRLNYFIT